MTNLSAQECEYAEYYPLVELASKYYSQKDYKESEINFKLAFEKTEFPLGKDLHLAFLVAEKIKDPEWAEQIAIQLAKGGVLLKYFRYYKKSEWFNQLKTDYKTYSDYYNANFETRLREEFKLLLEKDKLFVRRTMDWNYGTIEISSEDASKEANELLSELIRLTETYGFPSEKNMGYNYVKRLNKIEHYSTLALLIHIYKYGERIYENEVPNFICDGILHLNSKQILKQSLGFGNSQGIEHEMNVREKMYNDKKKQ